MLDIIKSYNYHCPSCDCILFTKSHQDYFYLICDACSKHFAITPATYYLLDEFYETLNIQHQFTLYAEVADYIKLV